MGPAIIPVVVGIASTGLLAAPATIGAAIGISAGLVSAIGAGLGVVGALMGTLLTPQPPKPKFADGSQSVKQAVPPRVRGYGRFRSGGYYAYYDTNDSGDLVSLTVHVNHEIDGYEQYWLNDKVVEVDEEGGVTTDNYEHLGTSYVFLADFLGTATQSSPDMPGEWDPLRHKMLGTAYTWMKCSDASAEDQNKVFPNGVPQVRRTLRGAKIFDPRQPGQSITNENTFTYSDNAALIILDYLTRTEASIVGPIPIGFGIPPEYVWTEKWVEAADKCASLVAKADGSFEPRWRLWGAYELNEERKKVLRDMLDCCGGRLVVSPEGKIGLEVGYPNPTTDVIITDDLISNYSIDPGIPATDRINEVRVTYIAEEQKWNEVEAGIQVDQASIDKEGVKSSSKQLRFCPTELQAQRIAREILKRGNPTHVGTITGRLGLMNAWGERWFRLMSDELEIDQICEIKEMRVLPTPDDISIEIDFISYDHWYEWSSDVDEKPAQANPPRTPRPLDIPPPTGIHVDIDHRALDINTSYAVGIVKWDIPTRPSLLANGRWRKVGDTVWTAATVASGARQFETAILEDNVDYEAQVQFRGSKNTVSTWAPPIPIQFTAQADPIPPAAPVGLTADYDAGTGQVTLTVAAPNDPHFAALRFYRGSTAVFGAAIEIAGPYYGAPGITAIYGDTPPNPGDWYYFATAENRSGVVGPAAGPAVAGIAPGEPVISTASATIGNANPIVTGTSYANATVRVYKGGVLNATVVATSGGVWSATLSGLALGPNSIDATADVDGNESDHSTPITLTRVRHDPLATLEVDFKNKWYRIAGVDTDASVSGWAGLLNVITVPAQIYDRGDGNLRSVAANTLPFVLTGELFAQRTGTNRNTNFNANPVTGVTTNLTVSGAGTLTSANDAAELALGVYVDASMAAVFTTGNSFHINTTGAVGDTLVLIGGTTATTTAHSFQICARSDGTFTVETNAGSPQTLINGAASAHYVRYLRENYTPASVGEQVRLRVPPNRDVWFNMNQLENSSKCSGPIVVAGASASRASPTVSRTALGGEWNQNEGYIGVRATGKTGTPVNGMPMIIRVDATHMYALQNLLPSTLRAVFQNVSAVNLDKTAVTLNALRQSVLGYKLNDIALAVDGATAITGSSFTPPTGVFNLLVLDAAQGFEGTIERLKFGTAKPTNANIQLMSGWDIS